MAFRLQLRFALALCLAVTSLVGTATLASAHARFGSSAPPAGSTVSALPAALQVNFTEELASIKFKITGPGGDTLVDAPGTIDLAHRTNASIALKEGGAGQYTVVWHNVSGDDGDPNDGAFTFTVAAAPGAAAPEAAPAPEPAANTPAASAPTCIDAGRVTPGITDVRINTYCKRQTIRDANKGKISEVVFNELVAEGVGLESALAEAVEAMEKSGH